MTFFFRLTAEEDGLACHYSVSELLVATVTSMLCRFKDSGGRDTLV